MSTSDPTPESQARKRRKVIARARAACNVCRIRKLACDAKRPRCTRCTQQNDFSCSYDTQSAEETRNEALKREVDSLKATLGAIAESFTALRELPPDATATLLLDVTAAENPVMELVDTGRRIQAQRQMLDSRISALETAKAVFPSPRSTLEFELNLLHPNAYPTFAMTEHADRLSVQMGISRASVGLGSPAALSEILPDSNRVQLEWDISVWTSVPISTRQATRALSVYFHTDHALLGGFDAELFLTDLVAGRSENCSRFLVNSLLYYCCLKLTAFEKDAGWLSESFRVESERLWGDDSSASALSLAALGYLLAGSQHTCNTVGANEYLAAGVRMGEQLRVWGPRDDGATLLMTSSSAEKRMLAFAAWSIFIHATFQAFRWWDRIPPEPPYLPVPEETVGARSTDVLEDFGVSEDVDYRAQKTFIAISKVLPVVRDAVIEFHRRAQLPRRGLSYSFAEATYKKLVECNDRDTYSLPTNETLPDFVSVKRMWFHMATMDMFRPFLHLNRTVRGFSASESSPKALYIVSLRQLQHLILVFRYRCPLALATPMWHGSIFFVANALATVVKFSESRNLFRLCVLMYADLVVSFPGLLDVFRAILLLGLQAGYLDGEESAGLVESVSRRREAQQASRVDELSRLAQLSLDDRYDIAAHQHVELAPADGQSQG